MNIVKSASKLSTAFITLYRQKQTGTRYGYFRPSNYLHKRYNYLYNPMINSEINDGFDIATNTAIEGKGFQDYSRNVSFKFRIRSIRSSNVSRCLKHFTTYDEHYII